MRFFRSLIALFVFTWMFSVTAFADRILTFQPTGFTLPSFQPTINGVPVGNPSYLADPATATTGSEFTMDSKNFSGMDRLSHFLQIHFRPARLRRKWTGCR